MVREYGHSLVQGPTVLMASLAMDPLGQKMFERWHYKDLHACPAIVEERLFDVPWQDGLSFDELAEDLVHTSIAREYL